ncbi:hypothetical protein [Chelatococcus reniformis]|uniref:Uncharacterized protein n=1 Tax=Chelatococcus reniformis TaxID=1494448 RepID=A0A916ULW2_9HYPH|nr:hypothetical protein [Chelatococcus reniformis]GGC76539.1 hypothetical protein GCM10010994_38560 [Chelatococcus reniformis]
MIQTVTVMPPAKGAVQIEGKLAALLADRTMFPERSSSGGAMVARDRYRRSPHPGTLILFKLAA